MIAPIGGFGELGDLGDLGKVGNSPENAECNLFSFDHKYCKL